MADPVEVLDFWLGDLGPAGWYSGTTEVDALCRGRFLDLWQAAAAGGLDHWVDGTVGTLAFLIVTDQMARNMHRGSALAFATDRAALAAAGTAVRQRWDMAAPEPERQFFYLPFTHSEDIADQDRGIALMTERLVDTGADTVLHARAHREVIARFGRFPSRNAALGRTDTADEVRFLADGGYGAVVRRLKAAAMQPAQGAAALAALPGPAK